MPTEVERHKPAFLSNMFPGIASAVAATLTHPIYHALQTEIGMRNQPLKVGIRGCVAGVFTQDTCKAFLNQFDIKW